jgi:hypothetical protein
MMFIGGPCVQALCDGGSSSQGGVATILESQPFVHLAQLHMRPSNGMGGVSGSLDAASRSAWSVDFRAVRVRLGQGGPGLRIHQSAESALGFDLRDV